MKEEKQQAIKQASQEISSMDAEAQKNPTTTGQQKKEFTKKNGDSKETVEQ